jgi:membrane protein implicated in regulation of membrane protease activity
VGLILDLAVAALALVVIGSLALLAWTLAVSAVHATSVGRKRVARSRRRVADAEARLPDTARRATGILAKLVERTASARPDRRTPTGEPPDA